MADCIFCKIVAGEIPCEKVHEDEKFFIFLDIHPVNPGHTLILPKQHVDHFFDIPEPLYSELFEKAKWYAPILKAVTGSVRTGMAIEGFGVPHTHLHMIPVNHGNELNPDRAKPATPEELKSMGEKIRDALKNSA